VIAPKAYHLSGSIVFYYNKARSKKPYFSTPKSVGTEVAACVLASEVLAEASKTLGTEGTLEKAGIALILVRR
jgi:hypothetical protein